MKRLLLFLLLPFLLSAQEVIQVDTVADLIALNPKLAGRVDGAGVLQAAVQVKRYSTSVPVGVGAGTYVWSPNYSGFTNALGGALAVTGGAWVDATPGPIDVTRFGARGDALANNTTIYSQGTDDATSIQAAIDWAVINRGNVVLIPHGKNGFYRLGTGLVVQRYDETIARLGITNSDTNSTYWDDRSKLKIVGDSLGTTLVADTELGMITIKGKDAYDGYLARVQNVVLEDINLHQMDYNEGSYCVSVFNAGFIALNRVRTRGGYISLKLSALSETQVNKCDFFLSNFGVWMERGNGSDAGDMAGVTLLDCQIMSQYNACVVAHYFRDIHIIGGFIGSREADIAAVWLSGLSPAALDSFWMEHVGMETDPAAAAPQILIGANGVEGVYSDDIYPLNTWTNTQQSFRGVVIDDCTLSVGSADGQIRIRGANTSMSKGLTVTGSRFDFSSSPACVVIESDVPDSVVVRYGKGNIPVDMIARTKDDRPYFLTTTVEATGLNLLNGGWRDMSKGGNNWIGATAPKTVITNLVGPFGVDIDAGSQQSTLIPIFAGSSPVVIRSNDAVVLDYAVMWSASDPSTAVRAYDITSATYYVLSTIGSQVEYGSYTNDWGVWKRYVAAIRPAVGIQFDHLAFNNFAETNAQVVLGYLAIYSQAHSGDMSSLSPSSASVWSGYYPRDHVSWSMTPTAGNWFARKWSSSGWAIREAFSGASTYSKGTCVSSSGNIYLATGTISSGGSAPTHSSGITDGWAFVATGSAATEERVVTRTETAVSLPATSVSGAVTTTGNIELGNASDTTIARASAGLISVEGLTVAVRPTTSALSYSGTNVTVSAAGRVLYQQTLVLTNNCLLTITSADGSSGGITIVPDASTSYTVYLDSAIKMLGGVTSFVVTNSASETVNVEWKQTKRSGSSVILANKAVYP
jgi:hypothetical protein